MSSNIYFSSNALTQACSGRDADPAKVLEAINNGVRPDEKTLTLACQKTRDAYVSCGPYGPGDDYLSGDIAQRFYRWESVVSKLVEVGAKGSPEACSAIRSLGYCYKDLIDKVENASKTTRECCIL